MSAGLSDDVSELVCSSVFSVFLSDTLLSGNIIAGLVSEAACGKPLASVAGEVSSVDDDGCVGADVGSGCSVGRVVVDDFSCGSLRDSSGLDSGADDCAGDSELEIDGDETGDEVVLNDGIGSSVSLDAGFGSGFVTEIGTAVGAGVAAAAGGALGASDEADDCVVLAGADGLLVSVLVDSDAGTADMVGDGDGDGDAGADTGVDSGAGADAGAAVGDGGVSGLMVNGGIGVDGVAAGDGGVDVGSDFSIGCGAVATGLLGAVDNDTVGCATD